MIKILNTLLLLSMILFAQSKETKEKITFPTMTMTDTTGKTYKVTGLTEGLKIEGLEDKIVFLEFFGHQCPPCLASIPHLINLQKKHAEKLAIVAIEVQGYNSKQTAKFAKEKGINYITISAQQALEVIEYIEQRAQWQGGIPFLVALNGEGAVQVIRSGMMAEETLEEIITDISKQNKGKK